MKIDGQKAASSGQDGGGTPPPNQPPEDTMAIDKARLQMLEQELEQTLNAVDKDFIGIFESSLTPEELELQVSDLKKFLELYETKKEEYLKTKIDEYGTKIGELKSKIADNEIAQMGAKAKAEFLAEYPDADLDALKEFYAKHITPAQQEELHKLPQKEAYAKLYEMFKTSLGDGDGDEGKAANTATKVPVRIDGQAGDVLNKTQESQPGQSPWMRNA